MHEKDERYARHAARPDLPRTCTPLSQERTSLLAGFVVCFVQGTIGTLYTRDIPFPALDALSTTPDRDLLPPMKL
jgi:hypothetical protein